MTKKPSSKARPAAPIIGGRLPLVATNPVRIRGGQVPSVHVSEHRLRFQPLAERILTGAPDRAEAKKRANLFAIMPAAATRQARVQPGRRRGQ